MMIVKTLMKTRLLRLLIKHRRLSAVVLLCASFALGCIALASAGLLHMVQYSRYRARALLPVLETANMASEKYVTRFTLQSWASARPERACLLRVVNPNATMSASELRCCLRKVREYMPRSMTQSDYVWMHAHGFSNFFTRVLPKQELARHGTCAVVSNAPAMRKYGQAVAEEIDSADAVFRVNKGPTRGFEKFVGMKETYRLINIHDGVINAEPIQKNLIKGDAVIYIREEMYRRTIAGNVSKHWGAKRRPVRQGPITEYMNIRKNYPNSRLYFNHPVFAELSLDALHRGRVNFTRRPLSTGMQAIVLALFMCDKVVSYEISSEDELSKKYMYYWQPEGRGEGYKWWHPASEEVALQNLLATSRRGNSSVYEYDMLSDTCL